MVTKIKLPKMKTISRNIKNRKKNQMELKKYIYILNGFHRVLSRDEKCHASAEGNYCVALVLFTSRTSRGQMPYSTPPESKTLKLKLTQAERRSQKKHSSHPAQPLLSPYEHDRLWKSHQCGR